MHNSKPGAPFLLACLACLNIACSQPRASVRLEFSGKALAECPAAGISELKDGEKPGGFKLSCSNPVWTLWAIYDTTELKDNRLKHLEFSPPPDLPAEQAKTLGLNGPASSLTFKTAVYSSALGKIDCATAKALKRTGGEAPIPRSVGGGLEPGDYPIELAQPCGRLLLTVRKG
ncbi:MAG: hypothetical protein ACAI44_01265 [Candidatus Sericytochromatia bacterium]